MEPFFNRYKPYLADTLSVPVGGFYINTGKVKHNKILRLVGETTQDARRRRAYEVSRISIPY